MRDPDHYGCRADHDFALAVLLFEDGQYDAASELAGQLCGTHRDADGRELTGIIYCQQEIYTAAAMLLRRLYEQHPERVTVRQTLIWVLAQDRRTIDEAQVAAWQAAGEQSDWSFVLMLRGIRRRQFWWLLGRVLLFCAGSTALLAACGAMVRMLCERSAPYSGSSSPTASSTGSAATVNTSVVASDPPRSRPTSRCGIDVPTLVWHTVNLLRLVGAPVTSETVASVINTAPRSEAEFFDTRWRWSSSCFKCLRSIAGSGTSDVRHRVTFDFWRARFTALRTESHAHLIKATHDALKQSTVAAIYHQYAKRWRREKRMVQK